jgi:hypothetical protein
MPKVELYQVAHARAGDKGNHSNISLIPYKLQDYEWLVEQVTEQRVADHFSYRHPTSVKRYLLPKLHSMNFVMENILDGGVNDSLNLDSHGKSLSFYLLSMQVESPVT